MPDTPRSEGLSWCSARIWASRSYVRQDLRFIDFFKATASRISSSVKLKLLQRQKSLWNGQSFRWSNLHHKGRLKMEHVVSAIAGELVSRLVSFLASRYESSSRACSEEKQLADRLQQLLLRAQTVVEEADARFITNSGMLAQLKVVGHTMYRGYWVLDTFKHRSDEPEEVISSDSSQSPALKRCRTAGVISARKKTNKGSRWWYLLQLQGAVESLENAADNMAEFVLLLGGCERLLRRPYDAYLYNDTVMSGRHAEKQELLNFMLLRHHSCSGGGGGRPAVLPVIGAPSIGKRTFVAHVCRDERVRSHFSSILHLNEDSFLKISDHGNLLSGKKTLLVVEFVSDVNEKDWNKFYSYVASSMHKESKVIIISRNRNSAKLGTVKPIFLECLPYEEFSYLFKTLVFASADPAEHHPRLARIADELARELQSKWSLVAANFLADAMRRNLDARFWLCVLNRVRRVAARNLAVFGEHPKRLVQRRHQIDLTDFVLDPAASSRLHTIPGGVSISSRGGSRAAGAEAPLMKRELPKVTLGDLLVDASVKPRGEFSLLIWESRLPPYTSYLHFVPSCDPDLPEEEEDVALQPGRKRRWLRF